MGKDNRTHEVLINCFFAGVYTQKTLSLDQLLQGFRLTDIHELKIRRSQSKELRGTGVCKKKSDPFDAGIQRIRSMFNVDDIIKLLTINPKYYDSLEFKKLVAFDKGFAKIVYERYMHKCKSKRQFPTDMDKYLPLFGLYLDEDFIHLAFESGNLMILKDKLSYSGIIEIEILYRHYSHLLPHKGTIIQLLDILYEYGIHVWTHDGTTAKLLEHCPHKNSDLSVWESLYENSDYSD